MSTANLFSSYSSDVTCKVWQNKITLFFLFRVSLFFFFKLENVFLSQLLPYEAAHILCSSDLDFSITS